MGKVSNFIPISDLRQDAARILKLLKKSKEPLVITQRERAAAVMLSVEAYECSEHDRQLLRLLAKGERDVEELDGYELDFVLAEADAVIADDPS